MPSLIGEPQPPTVSFDESMLPEIKDWDVGGIYKLIIEVEQTQIGKDTPDNEDELRAYFNVLSVAPVETDNKLGFHLGKLLRK